MGYEYVTGDARTLSAETPQNKSRKTSMNTSKSGEGMRLSEVELLKAALWLSAELRDLRGPGPRKDAAELA
jgi:hypothetical protein